MAESAALGLFDLSGQRALVTGSSQGIGLSLAQALGGAGASLLLNGRDQARLDACVSQLASQGLQVSAAVFDVTDPEQVERSIAVIEANVGPIDILVNNAGIQHRQPLQDFPIEAWRKVMSVNLDSVFYVSQAIARRMIARRRGKIINVASLQSAAARPGIAPYTASKGAVKNLTKGMCADWAQFGLQINAIAPGYFDTPMNKALVADPDFNDWLCKRTPTGRWGRIEELHGAVIFLASRASDFVNGQTIYVDGGVLAVL
jgi:gluconate 5-dehydrogenase